jgi:cell division protein FtsI (penicillin-binding protein 3)
VIIRALAIQLIVFAAACTSSTPAPETPAPEPSSLSTPAIDVDWQAATDREAELLQQRFPDATVRLAVLDLRTGELVAEVGPLGTPHLTASTIKTFTITAAFARGVDPNLSLHGAPADVSGHEVHDAHPVDTMTAADVLVRSSNVGTVRLVQKFGADTLYADVTSLLGIAPEAELDEVQTTGWLTGVGTRLTTLQLLHGYAVLAHGIRDPHTHEPIADPEAAALALDALERAVTTEAGTSNAAAIEGLRIAGKSGTAPGPAKGTNTALFFGIVSRPEPRWIVAVVLEGVPEDQYGGTVAAASFAAIVRGQVPTAQAGARMKSQPSP